MGEIDRGHKLELALGLGAIMDWGYMCDYIYITHPGVSLLLD